ncbi:YfiR family protein [Pseudoalteromonas sp. MMG012]|uniref:YfiR family protein n=1 Tax=Pseudoalteromonas sp. MMG012 TaxID=2822686 RepID=UPI001B39F8A6|nr:YfiR family protein [Pseudoalteromonas sp. MMG012]MBQ4849168.1 YfiR family protein [Pseudoalteromonas sp. MMG012]
MRSIFIILVLFAYPACAKSPNEVRSAFLYQMAKFIEFPNQQTKISTRFCFYQINTGPGAILAKNKKLKIRKRPIEVIKIENSSNIMELSQQCDITYIDETNENDILSTWTDTTSLNMVLVGDSIEFLKDGGVASLVQEGSKIRLYINKQQVTQHNFTVLSRLLAVSKFHPN